MATNLYLAMTAAEFHGASALPAQFAWMSCHFSPYALGISNLPEELPEGALLILSDIVPICGHDPQIIARQLSSCVQSNRCSGLLLDFQRGHPPEMQALADILLQHPPCPTAVSPDYASGQTCPVFLPPCPPYIPLKQYIAPWSEREIWLEASYSPCQLLLTAVGADISAGEAQPEGFADELLHCHYKAEAAAARAIFRLWRTEEDLQALLEEGRALGIRHFVGLYQELGKAEAPG